MNFAKKIRELRKINNLTQEQLATALNITPQAVSKWEMDASLPDLSMVPSIAAFFHVSTDELFGFDIKNIDEEIENIRLETGKYFWSSFEKAEEILLEGLKLYPASDKLKTELFELYAYNANRGNDVINKALELYGQIVNVSRDVFCTCRTKANLILIYQYLDKEKGQNHTAEIEKIIDSLPYMYPYMMQDRMRLSASCLKGKRAIEEATDLKNIEWQEFFIACETLGKRYFETEDYEKALENFRASVDVIERFMYPDKKGFYAYPICGTHANHAITLLEIAACLYNMGKDNGIDEIIKKSETVYFNAYSSEDDCDFVKNMTEQIQYFRAEYEKLKLNEYMPFDSSEYERRIRDYQAKQDTN